jgi:uncharacterized protein (DUF2336 family)
MHSHASLIDDLEAAIQSGSNDKRAATLRRVTDLFLASADLLSNQQIGVFDDVLGHLVQRIESKALAELSGRLAPVENAPKEVMRRLARHDEIVVAGPILTQSGCLATSDLVEIAKTKSQAHLLAISGRLHLEEFVTDALLQRGDRDVDRKVASNSGARFSVTGFSTLAQRAEKDGSLAEKFCSRRDIPLPLVRQLVLGATETVRSRLLAVVRPENRAEINRVLTVVSDEVNHEVTNRENHAAAQRLVFLMKQKGELDETALLEFARAGRYEEMLIALSLLCSAPVALVERLLHGEQNEVFLIPCRAAGFAWPTVSAVLNARSGRRPMSEPDLARAKADYRKLSKATAERVLRFWRVREFAHRGARPHDESPSGLADHSTEYQLSKVDER